MAFERKSYEEYRNQGTAGKKKTQAANETAFTTVTPSNSFKRRSFEEYRNMKTATPDSSAVEAYNKWADTSRKIASGYANLLGETDYLSGKKAALYATQNAPRFKALANQRNAQYDTIDWLVASGNLSSQEGAAYKKQAKQTAGALSQIASDTSLQDYWGQWDNEKEYTRAKQDAEEAERISRLDVGTLQNRIAELDQEISNLQKNPPAPNAAQQAYVGYRGQLKALREERAKARKDLSLAAQRDVQKQKAAEAEAEQQRIAGLNLGDLYRAREAYTNNKNKIDQEKLQYDTVSQQKELDALISRQNANQKQLDAINRDIYLKEREEKKRKYNALFQENVGKNVYDPEQKDRTYQLVNETWSDIKNQYTLMTDEERQTYNLAVAQGGLEAGKEYLSYLNPELNMRLAEKDSARLREIANEHPIAGAMINVGSGLFKPLGYAYTVFQNTKNKLKNEYQPIDPNSPFFGANIVSDATAEGLTQDMGETGKFLTQTGLSIAQNLFFMGFGKVGSLALMGLGSASGTARDVLQRGGSNEQAAWSGAAAGVAEVLFEKVSLENLIQLKDVHGVRDVLQNVLSQAGIEASEETLTELANTITDGFINGDLSKYQQAVTQYVAEGMSEDEAKKRAAADVAKDIGMAAAGGFVSGGVMAGGKAGAQYAGALHSSLMGRAENVQRGREVVQNGNLNALLSDAAQVFPDFQFSEQDKNSYSKIGKLSLDMEILRNASDGTLEGMRAAYAENPLMMQDTYGTPQATSQTADSREQSRPAQISAPLGAGTPAVDTEDISRSPEAKPTRQISRTAETAGLRPQTAQVKREGVPLRGYAEARYAGDNSSVQVTGVDHIDTDGTTFVRLSDGAVTSLENLDFTDQRMAQIYENASMFSSEGGKAFVSSYDGSDIGAYTAAWVSAYNQAQAGGSEAAVVKYAKKAGLSEAQALSAYYSGHNAYVVPEEALEMSDEEQKESKKIQNTPSVAISKSTPDNSALQNEKNVDTDTRENEKKNAVQSKGKFAAETKHIVHNYTAELTAEQQDALRIADIALDSLGGRTLYVEDQIPVQQNGDTPGATANAFFDASDNSYHLALDAADHAYLVVLAHESAHDIAANNKAGFQKLAEACAQYWAQEGKQGYFDKLATKYQKLGNSPDSVLEELVGNTVGVVLRDPDSAKQFADRFLQEEATRNLFLRIIDRIRDWLKETYEKIKNRVDWRALKLFEKQQTAITDIRNAYFEGLEDLREQSASNEALKNNGEKRYSMIGEKGKANDQTNALTEPIDTGLHWFVGNDGKLRLEISDASARINTEAFTRAKEAFQKLQRGDFSALLSDLDLTVKDIFQHDALFQLYPELPDTRVTITDLEDNTRGSYFPRGIMLNYRLTPETAKPVLLHEIQHYIQTVEGFASGGAQELAMEYMLLRASADADPREFARLKTVEERKQYLESVAEKKTGKDLDKLSYTVYRWLHGEIEARNTQRRAELSQKDLERAPGKNASYDTIFNWDDVHTAYQNLLLGDLNSLSKLDDDMDNQVALNELASNRIRGKQRPDADTLTRKDSGSTVEGSHSNDGAEARSEEIERRYSIKPTDSEGHVLSVAQEVYFADSKVRDAADNLMVVYHGSPAKFHEFSYAYMSMHGSSEGQGFYFTDNRNMAEGYAKQGGQLLEGYLNIQKPLSDNKITLSKKEVRALLQAVDPTGDELLVNYDPRGGIGYPSRAWYQRSLEATVNAAFEGSESDSEILAEIANGGAGTEAVLRTVRDTLGYDGYIVQDKYDNATVYVAFASNQFKSRDNTNPTVKSDIRYSLKSQEASLDIQPQDDTQAAQLQKLRNTLATQYQLTAGRKMTPAVAEKLAKRAIRATGSKYDASLLASDLVTVFDEAGKNFDADVFLNEGARALKAALSESSTFDAQEYAKYAPVRNLLQTTKITLSPQEKAEAAYAFDSYGDYRRALFGSVKLGNGGVSLDVFWQELSKLAPELFDAQSTNQVYDLYDAVQAIKKENFYVNEYAMNLDDAALSMFADLYADFADDTKIRTLVRQMESYAKKSMEQAIQREKQAQRLKQEKIRKLYAELDEKRKNALQAIKAQKEAAKGDLSSLREAIALRKEQLSSTPAGVERYNLQAEISDLETQRDALQNDLDAQTTRLQQAAEAYAEQMEKEGARLVQEGAKSATRVAESRQLIMQSRGTQKQIAKRRAQEATRLRQSIRGKTQSLMSTLLHGTDAKHIPELLRQPVAAFLEQIDMGFRAGSKAAGNWADKVERMRVQMEAYNAAEGSMQVDPYILEQLGEITSDIRTRLASVGKDARSLDLGSLTQLDTALDLVGAAIKNFDRLLAGAQKQRVSTIAERSIEEMNALKGNKERGKTMGMLRDFFYFGQMDAFTYADVIGNAYKNTIFKNLRNGLDEKTRMLKEVETAMQAAGKALPGETMRDKLKPLSKEKADVTDFQLDSGKSIRLTPAHVMELYLLNRRPQARSHIYGDGLSVETYKAHGKTIQAQSNLAVTEGDVERITDSLTAEQKRFADALQDFVSTTGSKWGNRVSLSMWGVKKFTEQNYWPITVDRNSTEVDPTSERGQSSLYRLKNLGMTKETVANAQNAVVLGDVVDTFIRHVDDMSSYAAYVLPLEDALRWLNFRAGKGHTTRDAMDRAFGKQAQRWLMSFMETLNGATRSSDNPSWYNALIRNYKTAAVSANLRVAIQQPSAYARASAVLDPKYLLHVKKSKAQMESSLKTAEKYAPIMQWKQWGFRDTFVAGGLRSMLVGDDPLREEIVKKSGALAGLADDITWGAIWNACAAETRDRTSLKEGTEAFYQRTAERFREVIDLTQVVDSPFHRSQNMRIKNAVYQSFTAFMSEPTKSYNLLMREAIRIKQKGWKASKKLFSRIVLSYVSASLLNALLASIVDLFRKDEEEGETAIQRYFGYVLDNFLEGVNPLSLVPIGKNILSMLDGFDFSNDIALEGIVGLIDATKRLWNAVANADYSKSWYMLAYDMAVSLSQLTGVPVGNAWRAVHSVLRAAGVKISREAPIASAASTAEHMQEEIEAGEQEKAKALLESRVQARTKELLREDPETYRTAEDAEIYAKNEVYRALAKLLSVSEDIRRAYEAKEKTDTATVDRIKAQLVEQGYPEEVVDQAIRAYATSTSGTDAYEAKSFDAKLYTSADLERAIEAGNPGDIRRIREELVKDSTAEDPGKAVDQTGLAYVKGLYLDAYHAGKPTDKLERIAVDIFGADEGAVATWVQKDRAAALYTALEAYDPQAANAAIVELEELGRTEKSITSSVSSKYRKALLEAYDSGDLVTVDRTIAMLTQLDLYTSKGEPYFSEQRLWGWILEKEAD